MAEYDDTNRGVLFREKTKRSEKSPDYRGKLDMNGEQFEIVGWIREVKNGKDAGSKFLSLKISEPRERQQTTEDPF
jgi:uncharacterized protein (DUF736 family)